MNRRNFLRGLAGVTISLPWLEAFAEEASKKSMTNQALDPTRLAFLFMPNGVHDQYWTPEKKRHDFKLSEALMPLDPIRHKLNVFTNLYHAQARGGDGHYAKTANFLSGQKVVKTTGKDLSCGRSVDQVAAQYIGKNTALPSIELATEPTRFGVDNNVGFTQIYGGHISWSSANTPMAKEIYPSFAFDRLFSKNSMQQDTLSVLDTVKDDTKALNKTLGREDQQRMDEFFTSLRSLEKRIHNQSKAQPFDRSKLKRPQAGIPESAPEHMEMMLDLIILAFQMKRTNIATFMFGNSVSGRDMNFIKGVDGGHHQISHHQGNASKLEMYKQINIFFTEMYSSMLQKMDRIKEGDKTLLDNSLVMFGSGMRDGNSHQDHNLPILLGGLGGGTKANQHLFFEKRTPLNRLYLTMLRKAGIPLQSFNDSGNEGFSI